MDKVTFEKLVQATIDRTGALLIAKGAEYAGDGDRLANFKRNAARNGQTVLECWMVYWNKHIDSIHSYMERVKDRATYLALQEVVTEFEALIEKLPLPQARTKSDKDMMREVINPVKFRQRLDAAVPQAMRETEACLSEPIEGRFDDNINYSFLCQAILAELRGKQQ